MRKRNATMVEKRGSVPSNPDMKKTKEKEVPDNVQEELQGEAPSRSKGGRPKGSKDSKPRKPRSDKGKARGKRTTK